MKYQIQKKNYNEEPVEFAMHDLLKDRGVVNPAEWLHSENIKETNPETFNNMKAGVNLLNAAITAQGPEDDLNIVLVVDSDVDGYTSSAIIVKFLKRVAPRASIKYVLHTGKQHGILIEEIPNDVDVIIVPDAGSSQYKEHMLLLEAGVKVIIIDHHEMDKKSEYPVKLRNNIKIINNQYENSPNPDLSGAGMALKFAQCYCTTYNKPFLQSLYSLAACGIVADVMDISNLENKKIIDIGLKYMGESIFLSSVIQKAHYNIKNYQAIIKDIGWVVGPNINAIIRLGTQEQKHTVFQALVNPEKSVPCTKRGAEGNCMIYEEAIRFCANAKKRQATAVQKSMAKIINSEHFNDQDNFIMYIDEDMELQFELSGLIANKLLSQYNKPTLLLRKFTHGEEEEYRGSVRGKPVGGLTNLKEEIAKLDGVNMAQGHAFAFGLHISQERVLEFKQSFNNALSQFDLNDSLYLVDFVSVANGVNRLLAEVMAEDSIWGHGVEKPLCAITGISSTRHSLMGNDSQHIKIDCGSYDVIMFNEPELSEMLMNGEHTNLDVVGEFSVDQAYNIGRLQFIVKDYELKDYLPESIHTMVF